MSLDYQNYGNEGWGLSENREALNLWRSPYSSEGRRGPLLLDLSQYDGLN